MPLDSKIEEGQNYNQLGPIIDPVNDDEVVRLKNDLLFQVAGFIDVSRCDGVEDCREGKWGIDCCFKHKVLTVTTDTADNDLELTDDRKNDKSFFLFDFATVQNVTGDFDDSALPFILQKANPNTGVWEDQQTFITDATGAKVYEFNDFPAHPTYRGIRLNWNEIAQQWGFGCYRLKAQVTFGELEQNFCSEIMEVKKWSCWGAHGTVRIDVNQSGMYGDPTLAGVEHDLCCVQIKDQIRIPAYLENSLFPEYEEEVIKYQTGVQFVTKDEAIQRMVLRTGNLPIETHKRLAIFAFMGSDVWVTDYNIHNDDYKLNMIKVKKDGGYTAEDKTNSRYRKVNLDLVRKEQTVIRETCCDCTAADLIGEADGVDQLGPA